MLDYLILGLSEPGSCYIIKKSGVAKSKIDSAIPDHKQTLLAFVKLRDRKDATMGRLPISEEKKRYKMIQIIQATEGLIKTKGLKATTLRTISNAVHCNSASLYKYFTDLDELLLYACINNFKAYIDELAAKKLLNLADNDKATYMLTWKLFCVHCFANPEVAYHIFFSKHSPDLQQKVATYFGLFPQELASTPVHLLTMVTTADLKYRNWILLKPLLKDKANNRQMVMINDLTIAFFQMILSEKIMKGNDINNNFQTMRMLQTCQYLLTTAKPK